MTDRARNTLDDYIPLLLVAVGLIVIVLAGWLAPKPAAPAAQAVTEGTPVPIPPLPELKPGSVALGELTYKEHCAACHSPNLEGQPNWKKPLSDGRYPAPPHDDSGHTWHHPDHLLYEIILNGGNGNPGQASNMPAFKGKLTGLQLVGVMDYIKSRWSDEKRQYQWEMTMTKH
jgi:S-disulfanyl-L-cysteine oxidoreductase SoxD